MGGGAIAAALLAWLPPGAATAATPAAAPSAPAPAPERGQQARTEEQLRAVRTEIARIRARVSRDQIESDHLQSGLRSAELAVAAARSTLDELRRNRADRAAHRAELATRRAVRERSLEQERTTLAAQARAAYLIGREEPLKLLLNQREPALAGRMLAYYGYFGRARAAQLAQIEADVAAIDSLDHALAAEDAQLAALEASRASDLAALEQARLRRADALAALKSESHSRAQTLASLQHQQSGLESLLRELRRALRALPGDVHDAFSGLKGKLAWPVSGQLVAHYGQVRAGAVHWDGVLIDTERGSPVHAVSPGRVVFADWLPGLGLLTIIDHGEGYLSLYAHNERLYKAVGERVAAGEVIATAGDTGGTSRPQLYFEIRKAGRPVDPRPWFHAPAPGTGG